MNDLLRTFTDELRNLLNAWLPQLSADWWKRHVLEILTYQQQERVKQSRIDNLSGLDLAALLRVLDHTLERLARMLGVGDAAQTKIAAYKQQQLSLLSPTVAPSPSLPPVASSPAPAAPTVAAVPQTTTIQDGFAPGQLVRLKSNHAKICPLS